MKKIQAIGLLYKYFVLKYITVFHNRSNFGQTKFKPNEAIYINTINRSTMDDYITHKITVKDNRVRNA